MEIVFSTCNSHLHVLFLWIFSLHFRSASVLPGARDICHYESFNASCAQNEVILMETARYGRMAAGRCVSREYGYVGCYSDVVGMVDSQCSGRRKCTMAVSYFVNNNVLPCPKDVTSYLEVSYQCLSVSHSNINSCVGQRELTLTSTSGYISSYLAAEGRLGSSTCPWVVKVREGQKINFTLIDFGVYSRTSEAGGGRHSLYCEKYAEIRDGLRGQETPICAGVDREKNVYVSKGSTVYVTIPRIDQSGPHFLLKYQAIGCPSLRAPSGTTAKTSGDGISTMVTCDATGESWQMTCRNSRWHGKPGNCTAAASETSWTSLFGKEWSSSDGLLVVIALGVGLGIVIGVCLLAIALVVLKRRGWKLGCGKQNSDDSPEKNQVYDYNTSVSKGHTYTSGYGSEALLNDIPIDPRYNTGHYGDLHSANWGSVPSAGVHGYNRSRGSQNSLRHIYESPDFINTVRAGSGPRDAC